MGRVGYGHELNQLRGGFGIKYERSLKQLSGMGLKIYPVRE